MRLETLHAEMMVDLGLMILTNALAQWVAYGAAATAPRVSTFALLMIGFALARRYGTRVWFEAWSRRWWRTQPRWHSALEVGTDTVIGLGMAVGLQLLIYGQATSVQYAGGVTLVCYGVLPVRRYVLRRIMERWEGCMW